MEDAGEMKTPYLIKVCGITNPADAVAAVDAGATAIGINFFTGSKRYVAPERAREIADAVRGRAAVVGVFVNEPLESAKAIAAAVKLTYCQFHGDETPEYVGRFQNAFKAFRIDDAHRSMDFDDYHCPAFLLDAYSEQEYGGTGRTFDWLLAREANEFGRIIVAGGLTPDNVAEAVDTAQPWGVDVSSGVESAPGVKDHNAMARFITAARTAFTRQNS